MANPQAENGHIDIANEIVEALARTYLSPTESKVLWAILRKTYGWHKKIDRISYSQLEELTGLNRRHIAPVLKRLVSRNIVTQTGNGQALKYGLQKDFDRWAAITQTGNGRYKPLPKQVTVDTNHYLFGVLPLPKQVTEPLPKQVTTKETKETIQKKYIYTVPEWIKKDVWNDFLDMRKRKRAIPTEKAKQLLVKELEKLRAAGNDPSEVLNQSIMRNYTGVFPIQRGNARGNGAKGKMATPDELKTGWG